MENVNNITKEEVMDSIKKNLEKNKEISHEFNEIIFKEVREVVSKIEVEENGRSR